VSGDNLLLDGREFSFVLGGPLFQLLRRTPLSDDALTRVRKRMARFDAAAMMSATPARMQPQALPGRCHHD